MTLLTKPDMDTFALGIDVGSTTVKCVLLSESNSQLIYQSYQRHETQQVQTLVAMLEDMFKAYPSLKNESIRIAITGSGASTINQILNAFFVQEVNAVTFAVESLHPTVKTVFELGGQDAKMILFKDSSNRLPRQVVTSMNDKCASGTGATIEKCVLKVGLSLQQTKNIHFDKHKIHKVSAKCGVFAETDIVNLLKSSVPKQEILNSLADAIVTQNLSVLAKGHTIESEVLLLGGPHYFLPFLVQCWQSRLTQLWQQLGLLIDTEYSHSLIKVPDNALYYAALGAARFSIAENCEPVLLDLGQLCEQSLTTVEALSQSVYVSALCKSKQEQQDFIRHYQQSEIKSDISCLHPASELYLGLDGGSTSSKAVLVDKQGKVIVKKYCLSNGNPISDLKQLLLALYSEFVEAGVDLQIAGVGVTGYAADVYDSMIKPDAAPVETVAHFLSSVEYFGNDIDVICDIGGQDTKVIYLKNGEVDSFKLSNQCSAGNGMLLQAAANQFGVKLEEFSDLAFAAEKAPDFSYGCAVFLDSDRVNFQKQGYNKQELFAGLVQVLPKNIWQYVAQISRLNSLGRKFVLQGGVQKNLAAVKAQVDYIKERVEDAEVFVHPYCAEAGAIGAALQARSIVEKKGYSTFIGLQNAINLKTTTITNETTRCHFCENACVRTFVDSVNGSEERVRFISGYSCEKGSVESKELLKQILKQRKQHSHRSPNLIEYEVHQAFSSTPDFNLLPDASTIIETQQAKPSLWGYGPLKRATVKRYFKRSDAAAREDKKIAIPKVLGNYQVAIFLRVYLMALGIKERNVIFSDSTNESLWQQGARYAVNDPCYPAKVSVAHVQQLIYSKKKRFANIDFLWFPVLTHLPSFLRDTMANTCCPVVSGTPAVVQAAFAKEQDHFRNNNIDYVCGSLNLEESDLLKSQLYNTWEKRLKITRDENDWAVDQGINALEEFEFDLQKQGKDLLEAAEQNQSLIILLLCRPYHNDEGINHKIMDEFQSLGYPILTINAIPKDESYLSAFFKSDIDSGYIKHCFDIDDVWPENFSVNSAQKVWAAKFATRHPNIAVVDISSFKCGHDAPTYSIIDAILSSTKTPHLTLHDLDGNKPVGTLKLRIKTFAYVLDKYQKQLRKKRTAKVYGHNWKQQSAVASQ